MDLGIELLMDQPGCLSAPLGFSEKMREYKRTVFSTPHGSIDPYVRLSNATTVPMATGKDLYLKEAFQPLFAARGISMLPYLKSASLAKL